MKKIYVLSAIFGSLFTLLNASSAYSGCCTTETGDLQKKACSDGTKYYKNSGDPGVRLCASTSLLFTDRSDQTAYLTSCNSGFECTKRDARQASTSTGTKSDDVQTSSGAADSSAKNPQASGAQ